MRRAAFPLKRMARGTAAVMAAVLMGNVPAQAPSGGTPPGTAESAYLLARQYRGDTGTAIDLRRAHDWMRRAAEQGHRPAQVDIAFTYLSGNHAVPKDASQAFQWFSEAAGQGAVQAQCMLGDFHRAGLGGVDQDEVAAFGWYSKAAVQEDRCAPKAQYELYVSYEAGRGVKPNLPMAMHWLQRAARGNDPRAQATLGRHYERGYGVQRDPGLAVSWRKRSREGVSHHDDHDHVPAPCPRWVTALSAKLAGCAV